MEGIVISSLKCRMSCSPTPVPQRKTGGGELGKNNLNLQRSKLPSKEYLQGLILPLHYSSHFNPVYKHSFLTGVFTSHQYHHRGCPPMCSRNATSEINKQTRKKSFKPSQNLGRDANKTKRKKKTQRKKQAKWKQRKNKEHRRQKEFVKNSHSHVEVRTCSMLTHSCVLILQI